MGEIRGIAAIPSKKGLGLAPPHGGGKGLARVPRGTRRCQPLRKQALLLAKYDKDARMRVRGPLLCSD
jgi:hypothetical protein